MNERFQLFHGKCEDVLKTLPDKSVDLILADPPYATTACLWDQPLDWPSIWPQLWRVAKSETTPVVLFSAQPFTTDLIQSQRKCFRYELIIEKAMPTGFLNANLRPLCAHENICVFSRSGFGNYNVRKEQGSTAANYLRKAKSSNTYNDFEGVIYEDDGTRHPTSVIHSPGIGNKRFHSSQKHLDVMQKLILMYSNENDLVLDFTFGSGTTGIAALQTDRRFVGIESDKKFYEIGRNRISDLAAQISIMDFIEEPTPPAAVQQELFTS